MKKIIKARWFILLFWLVATIALTATQPDLNAILRNKSQEGLNENSPSVMADALLSKMEVSTGSSNLIVFYNPEKITNQDLTQIEAGIQEINASSSQLGISQIIDPFSLPEAKSSLISKDGTTLMVNFKLDKGTREVDEIKDALELKLKNVQVTHYFTGEVFINNDYTQAAFSGVEKSAVLTVLFILVVLILLFRSIITPVVSLIIVVLSYLCSMGITSHLVEKANFPVTNLTQILLMLILFGIGTDYNILLFNRFKEELSHGLSVDDAILTTYKTAGKTISYSILTVFIAFLSLIFSESPIYKSGIVIVIGSAVLLLEIMTLTPFVMKVLGKKLFWPSKQVSSHKESKLWHKISSASIKHPLISLLIVALIAVPSIYFHHQQLNFDNIAELGDSYPSTIGFNLIAEHFGRGQAMPVSLVIENANKLDNSESLAVIDVLTERLKTVEGVSKVVSVTQPQSKKIDSFYIGDQLGSVTDGLEKTSVGVSALSDGLKTATDKLSSADFSQVTQMTDGTNEIHNGLTALTNGLSQLQAGISDSSEGSKSISSGLTTLTTNLAKTRDGLQALAAANQKMQAGYAQMGESYQGATQVLLATKSALTQMQALTFNIGNSYSNAQSDASYISLKQTIDQTLSILNSITPESVKILNDNYAALTAGFAESNDNLIKMNNGLTQMITGLETLNSGIDQAASGIGTIVTNMNRANDGLAQIADGQAQLSSGLTGFSSFGDRLSEVTTGLDQISDGLTQTTNFLSQLTTNNTFYIPNEALNNEGFKQSLDAFMSKDRKITKLMIILNNDPYSEEAMNTINTIKKTLPSTLQGTTLTHATVGIAGPSAMMCDMNDVLSRDLNRMIVIVLIGVFLVLLLVIRSFGLPVYITAALISSYYIAMFVLNFITLKIMGLSGVSSFVPFFSFIIIVALGVDYSIFLMMRFKEYPHLTARKAIVMASTHIGGVITSAVIILGGTFATLMPSGLSLLIQLAIAVITGLIVLCFLFLPVFLPAMIALQSILSQQNTNDNKVLDVQSDSN